MNTNTIRMTNTERIKILTGSNDVESIGSGTYSQIYSDGEKAFKIDHTLGFAEEDIASSTYVNPEFVKEIVYGRMIDCDSILRLGETYLDKHGIIVSYPRMTSHVGDKVFRRSMNYDLFKQFLISCLNGIRTLHSRGIGHCDLRPENILYTRQTVGDSKDSAVFDIQICDLNLCQYIPIYYEGTTRVFAECTYLNNMELRTFATDIRLLGVTLFEICTDADISDRTWPWRTVLREHADSVIKRVGQRAYEIIDLMLMDTPYAPYIDHIIEYLTEDEMPHALYSKQGRGIHESDYGVIRAVNGVDQTNNVKFDEIQPRYMFDAGSELFRSNLIRFSLAIGTNGAGTNSISFSLKMGLVSGIDTILNRPHSTIISNAIRSVFYQVMRHPGMTPYVALFLAQSFVMYPHDIAPVQWLWKYSPDDVSCVKENRLYELEYVREFNEIVLDYTMNSNASITLTPMSM